MIQIRTLIKTSSDGSIAGCNGRSRVASQGREERQVSRRERDLDGCSSRSAERIPAGVAGTDTQRGVRACLGVACVT